MFRKSLLTLTALSVAVASATLASSEEPGGNRRRPRRPELQRQITELKRQVSQLKKQVAELSAKRRASAKRGASSRINIFPLENANATQMAKLLRELLVVDGKKTIGVAADPHTNSIIVRAKTGDARVVEGLIVRLESDAKKRALQRSR